MICPLLSIGTVVKQLGYEPDVERCQEEDCAWWDDNEKGICAILEIAVQLHNAVFLMDEEQSADFRRD